MSQTQEYNDIETSTTALKAENAPDSKTRRYDRQLRLWAASGQNALESSRILVISGTATSTSALKNLVLPGIGHFTILDPAKVTGEDAGNNFFLEGSSSIGKSRAEEAVRLLGELNDGVEGKADVRSLEEVLAKDKEWLSEFTIVIAHNLEAQILSQLSTYLWEDPTNPPLVVVRSAGFLAEFYLQYHEHTVIESHPETAASLLIDRPFPALLDYATTLDFDAMDVTDHAHVPYVVILVKLLEEWKKTHNGAPPTGDAERKAFKKSILALQKKSDEENFEEAEAQAYRTWTASNVPYDIQQLFKEPKVLSLTPESAPFYHLVHALKKFTEEQPSRTLPLTGALPDMKASTDSYIHLQKMYKTRAEEEKKTFKSYLQVPVPEDMVDAFLKNSHALKLLRGQQWGAFEADQDALVEALNMTVSMGEAMETQPKELAIHLALSGLSTFLSKHESESNPTPTLEDIRSEVLSLLPSGTELPEYFDEAFGEVVRSPTADLPNTAALLGGFIAQEVIKLITKQYIPMNKYCTIDLIGSTTGMIP
ncbi:hypothetical protein D9619_010598 [Psilocybe cf. subviscida]|uniref:NEDD8-activating enzyme E1 regulatory subunit n=1 Tax=Psilocybe cf. subviscida TaxID=2480587 RepID=A0A8H5ASI5_9AGAR|nr:hypothetical protein D9619_010598 [Psilocybe cf. subviscida]